jgi:hypothetical protein
VRSIASFRSSAGVGVTAPAPVRPRERDGLSYTIIVRATRAALPPVEGVTGAAGLEPDGLPVALNRYPLALPGTLMDVVHTVRRYARVDTGEAR